MKEQPDEDKPGANSRVDKAQRRNLLGCSFCPPHGGENKTYKKRGVKKPRGKK